jgi:cell division protein FtsA
MIQDELRRVGKNGMLPAGVVLTGGGAKLDGITEVAKHILQLPVEVGEITHNISGMVDNIADPLYASSVGLMLWGLEANNSSPKKGSGIKIPGSIGKARSFFKRFFL